MISDHKWATAHFLFYWSNHCSYIKRACVSANFYRTTCGTTVGVRERMEHRQKLIFVASFHAWWCIQHVYTFFPKKNHEKSTKQQISCVFAWQFSKVKVELLELAVFMTGKKVAAGERKKISCVFIAERYRKSKKWWVERREENEVKAVMLLWYKNVRIRAFEKCTQAQCIYMTTFPGCCQQTQLRYECSNGALFFWERRNVIESDLISSSLSVSNNNNNWY